MLTYTVDVKVPGLNRLSHVMSTRMAKGSDPAVDAMFAQWGKRYERYARARYARLGRGGGEWKPLAKSTIERRRTGGKYRKYGRTRGDAAAEIRSRLGKVKGTKRAGGLVTDLKYLTSSAGTTILRDTGILFAAMQIGSTGNQYDRIPFGARYGFRPLPHGSGTAKSIQRIAGYHQTGGRHLPQRRIIVQPDAITTRGMANDAGRAMRAMLSARGGAT